MTFFTIFLSQKFFQPFLKPTRFWLDDWLDWLFKAQTSPNVFIWWRLIILEINHQSHCGFWRLVLNWNVQGAKKEIFVHFFSQDAIAQWVVCRRAEEASSLIACYYTKIIFCWKNITDFNQDHINSKTTLPFFPIHAFTLHSSEIRGLCST